MPSGLRPVPPFAREEAPKRKFTKVTKFKKKKKKLEPAKFLPARGERTGVRTNSKIIFRPLKTITNPQDGQVLKYNASLSKWINSS